MLKIMLTKGLRGRSNLEQYHENCKKVVQDHYGARGIEFKYTSDIVEFKHIEGFDYTNNRHRLTSLLNTLESELLIADEVVFMDNWQDFDGCCIEHEICTRYGIKCIYLQSQQIQ